MTEETKALAIEQPKKGINAWLIVFLSLGGLVVLGAFLILVGGMGFLFFLNYYVGPQIRGEAVNESEVKKAIKDTARVPDGFPAFNNKVAYKYAESGSYTCPSRTRCIQMEVVSKDGCDSLYVAMAEVNSSGANVGYHKETRAGLAAGQKAILMPDTYNEAADTFRLSKISCY